LSRASDWSVVLLILMSAFAERGGGGGSVREDLKKNFKSAERFVSEIASYIQGQFRPSAQG
jgi:hypothetical protein